MSRARNPRCTWINNDGTRCARRVPPPDTLCHLHVAVANGGTISPNKRIELDEIEILKKLAQTGEPAIKLRAVDLLLQLKKEGRDDKPTKEPPFGLPANTFPINLDCASPTQLVRLRELFAETRQIVLDIRAHMDAGGEPFFKPETDHAPEQQHQEPTGTAQELPGPTAKEPSAPVLNEREAGPTDEEVVAAILEGRDIVIDPSAPDEAV
jgi:hypothetical protein